MACELYHHSSGVLSKLTEWEMKLANFLFFLIVTTFTLPRALGLPEQNLSLGELIRAYLSEANEELALGLRMRVQHHILKDGGSEKYFENLSTLQTHLEAIDKNDSEQQLKATELVFGLQDLYIFQNIDYLMKLESPKNDLDVALGAGGVMGAVVGIYLVTRAAPNMSALQGKDIAALRDTVGQIFYRLARRSHIYRGLGRLLSSAPRAGVAVGGRGAVGLHNFYAIRSERDDTAVKSDPHHMPHLPVITSDENFYPSPLEVLTFEGAPNAIQPIDPVSFPDQELWFDINSVLSGFLVSYGFEKVFRATPLFIHPGSLGTEVAQRGGILRYVRLGGPGLFILSTAVWYGVAWATKRWNSYEHRASLHQKISAGFTDFESAASLLRKHRAGQYLTNAIGEYSGYVGFNLMSLYNSETRATERRLICLALSQPSPLLRPMRSQLDEWRDEDLYRELIGDLKIQYGEKLRQIFFDFAPSANEIDQYLSKALHLLKTHNIDALSAESNRLLMTRLDWNVRLRPDHYAETEIRRFDRIIASIESAKRNVDRSAYEEFVRKGRCRSPFEEHEFRSLSPHQ